MKDEPELYAAYLYGVERGKAIARTINHSARPPMKVRKHVHRMHHAFWDWDWYNHAPYRVNYQSEQPQDDGA